MLMHGQSSLTIILFRHYYNSQVFSGTKNTGVEAGELVAVNYDTDQWYRALVSGAQNTNIKARCNVSVSLW